MYLQIRDIRLWLLSTNHRIIWDFSWTLLDSTKSTYEEREVAIEWDRCDWPPVTCDTPTYHSGLWFDHRTELPKCSAGHRSFVKERPLDQARYDTTSDWSHTIWYDVTLLGHIIINQDKMTWLRQAEFIMGTGVIAPVNSMAAKEVRFW